jgi:hypothetical protein
VISPPQDIGIEAGHQSVYNTFSYLLYEHRTGIRKPSSATRRQRFADKVMVLRKGPILPLLESLPQIARSADNQQMASPELVVADALPRISDNLSWEPPAACSQRFEPRASRSPEL